jgi:hypothetical protein
VHDGGREEEGAAAAHPRGQPRVPPDAQGEEAEVRACLLASRLVTDTVGIGLIYMVALLDQCVVVVAGACRLGVAAEKVEVSFKGLTVEADVRLGRRAVPTLLNCAINAAQVFIYMSNSLPSRPGALGPLHTFGGDRTVELHVVAHDAMRKA